MRKTFAKKIFLYTICGLILRRPYLYIRKIMTKIELNAEVRGKDENLRTLRSEKIIPGVVYGKTQEPISIKMGNSDLLRVYRKAGESTIINLKVGKKDLEVLIHKIQREPVSGEFLHMDFYALTRGKKLSTKIALSFINEAPAVKLGAIIDEIVRDLEVKCMPRDLVDHFEVDLSVVKEVWDSIHISDLGLDTEKYELTLPQDTTIVVASKIAKEVEPVEEEAVTGADEEESTEEGEK